MGEGGDASRYANVNPYTDTAEGAATGAQSQFMGYASNALTNFNQALGNVPSITGMMVNPGQYGNFDLSQLSSAENMLGGAYDKAVQNLSAQNMVGQLGQIAPFLQSLSGPGSDYINNTVAQALQAGTQGLQGAMQQLASGGNVWSGAGAAAASEAMINPMLAAQQNIFNTANQNYMGLLQQGMGQLGQGNRMLGNLGLQQAMGQADIAGLGLQAQQAGQGLQQNAALANQQTGLQAQMANQSAALDQAGLLANIFGQNVGGATSALGVMGNLGQRETVYQPTWWERVGSDLVGGLFDLGGAALGFGGGGDGGLFSNLFGGGDLFSGGDNYGGLNRWNPNVSKVRRSGYSYYDVNPNLFEW